MDIKPFEERAAPDQIAVSVLIPVFNRPVELRQAIESVRAQTFASAELIVVDDGSQPRIEDQLDAETLEGVVVVRSEQNQGASSARNLAVQAAKGNYLAFLDSDDRWRPEKLEAQISFMRREDSQVSTTGYWIWRDGAQNATIPEIRLPSGEVGVRRLIWGVDLSPGSTLIVRRDLVDQVGFQDSEMRRLEDWDWLLRIAYQCTIDVLDQPLADIYIGRSTYFDAIHAGVYRVFRKHARPLTRRSPLNLLRFLSSGFLELAAAAHRARRTGRAIIYGIVSVAFWPFRNFAFYLRVLTRFRRRDVSAATVSQHNPLRVLHIITGLGLGGAERMLFNVLAYQASLPGTKDIQHTVVSLTGDGVYGLWLRELGIDVVGLEATNIASSPTLFFRLSRLIRRTRPHVVKCWMYHGITVGSISALLSGRRRKLRLYWGIRCSDMNLKHYSRSLSFIIRFGALLSFLPDMIVANSFRGLRIHRELGYRTAHMAVLENGVDVDRFQPNEDNRAKWRERFGAGTDDFVVGIVARVDPMKGYDTLREALERCPRVKCVAIGLGTDQLPQTGNFLGLGARNDVEETLSAFDALVSASRFGEGWSNSIAEGMAAGLPVITTDVGDSARLVGNTGIVIGPGDPAELAAALEKFRRDSVGRKAMGAAARRRMIEQFSLARSLEKYRRLFVDGVVAA